MATETRCFSGKPHQSPGHARNAVPDVYTRVAFNKHLHVDVTLGTMRYCCPEHWPGAAPDPYGSYVLLLEPLTD